jgi:hypothetical protein
LINASVLGVLFYYVKNKIPVGIKKRIHPKLSVLGVLFYYVKNKIPVGIKKRIHPKLCLNILGVLYVLFKRRKPGKKT